MNNELSSEYYSTVVSRKYAPPPPPPPPPPPFANLASVQNPGGGGGGGVYTGCNNFFRDYALHSAPNTCVEGEEAGCFRKVAGVSIVDPGGPCSR